MTDNAGDYGKVKIAAYTMQVSEQMLMDAGLIPDTRPPLPPPTRRQRLRWWWRDNLSLEALRTRLAAWIDPVDRDDDWA